MEGLVDGMNRASELYEAEEYFVTDVLPVSYTHLDVYKRQVLTYANMRGIREIDRIVELCKRDLAFIWLSQGRCV